MARLPARRGSAVPRLTEANHEPDDGPIRNVVRLLNGVFAPLTRRDWRYTDRIPETGGIIVVANHISNVDPIVLGQYLAYAGRWPRFLAKASVLRAPLVGRLLAACGQIPVERDSASSRDALVAAADALREGRAVVIYPEGTITGDPDLWPMRGRTGAARLALDSGCPVIPIGQWGAQAIMYGPTVGFPRMLPRKTVQVAAGPPVELSDLSDRPRTAALLNEATERMMTAITALVAELRDATPPPTRFDPRRRRTEKKA